MKSKKRDDDKGFDLATFKRKHFLHFASPDHVSQCTCDPNGCPFKDNFGSSTPGIKQKEETP